MERIQSINPARIEWCCADHGITLETLAAEVGISIATLQRVMAEEAGLTFGQLGKIANYFGRGVLFFLEQEPVNVETVHTPEFRTLANQKPELSAKVRTFIERVERQREVYLALRDELPDVDFPTFEPPVFDTRDIAQKARIVRTWLGLNDTNNFNSYRLAVESKGILVFRTNGYNGKWQISADSPIFGFTLYNDECPVIVVKKQDADAQQSFTLMHELGHLLLHKASSIDDEHDMHSHKGREQEANAFAGHLLVPDELLRKIPDEERPMDASEYDTWLAPFRRSWAVSGEVILRRLLDSGRLSQQQYMRYREAKANAPLPPPGKGNRQFRHREPKHIFGDRFVRTVLGALNNRRITLAKASTYLDGLKVSDVHALERYYAGL